MIPIHMEVSFMKLSKNILIIFIFLITLSALTACNNTTAYVNDQTGKEITITTSDDTYTFKLPATEAVEVMSFVPESEAEETQEPTTTVVESEGTNTDSNGPKTGEP